MVLIDCTNSSFLYFIHFSLSRITGFVCFFVEQQLFPLNITLEKNMCASISPGSHLFFAADGRENKEAKKCC